MSTRFRTARRTLVRSTLAGLALIVAIPAMAIAAHPFADVPGGQWFSGAVDWAYDNNITTGVSPTEFGGEQGFTRYQAVTMLERMDTNIIQPGLEGLADDVSDVADNVADVADDVSDVADDMSTVLHAVANGDGSLESSRTTSGVSAIRHAAGRYEVNFPIDVSTCAWQATLSIAHDGGLLFAQPDPVSGSIGLAPDFDTALDNKGIYVETWDSAGTNADRDFTVSVTCSPLGGYGGPIVVVALP